MKHWRQVIYAEGVKPGVARNELPWEPSKKRIQPQRGLRPGSSFGGTALRFDRLWLDPRVGPQRANPGLEGVIPLGYFYSRRDI